MFKNLPKIFNKEASHGVRLDSLSYYENNDEEELSFFPNDDIIIQESLDNQSIDSSIDSKIYFIQKKEVENKSITKDNSSTTTNPETKPLNKKSKKIFDINKINRKRGRIPKNAFFIIFGIHNKYFQDNIIIKIKRNFLEAIYDTINNEYEKYLISKNDTDNGKQNIKKLILRINPKFVEEISKEENLKWFSSKLKDVLSVEISSKYNRFDKDYNKRQIESLYREIKAKNVIDILEKTVREMFYIYCNNISFNGFKTLNDDLDKLRRKMENDGEEAQNIIKYLEKYEKISCNFEKIFLMKSSRKKREK